VLTKGVRRFAEEGGARRLDRDERTKVVRAFRDYLETIPESKRFDRSLFYELRDVVGKSGFGIGSAGMPAYNVLVEGYSQALDNDVVLSMKQANVPAVSRFVDASEVDAYFEHEGQRTAVSQRALQVHTDPLLGHTKIDGVGYVVSEISPYEVDLDWSAINEPEDMQAIVDLLGRAPPRSTAPPTRTASRTSSTPGRGGHRDSLRAAATSSSTWLTTGGSPTPCGSRGPHLFVEAFREGAVGITRPDPAGSAASMWTCRRTARHHAPSRHGRSSAARSSAQHDVGAATFSSR
jgi:hypothetical protein